MFEVTSTRFHAVMQTFAPLIYRKLVEISFEIIFNL